MPRRILVRLLYRLDRSPLPMLDHVRLELEAEVLAMLAAHTRETARTVRCEPLPVNGAGPNRSGDRRAALGRLYVRER